MSFSILDVVLVAVFLTAAIVGGACGVLSKELVAAIITAAIAFLAARGKTLFDKNARTTEKPGEGDRADAKGEPEKPPEEGAPDKPQEGHHSHRIIVGDDGSIRVEDVDVDKPLPDEHKIVTGDDLEPKEE